MKSNHNYTGLEIAIIGVACRFPGADNWRQFWRNLVNGTESVHFFSDKELMARGLTERTINQTNFIRAQAILQNKDLFDSAFFDYRPAEAKLMNPVHRIFHECVWEALEDAGYDPYETKELIGLYAGAGADLNWKVYSMLRRDRELDDFTLNLLINENYLTSLLSYKLNLKGPSFSLNTACSTSLVAVNLACKSLLLGEAKMALAGGASIITEKSKGHFYQEGMISSSDGHCRAFDKDADGCVGGEGAGVVVLKRLAEAINDRNHIYAIIKGSAINNDGNGKVGYTAPGVIGQADCIKRAQIMAGVEPESISYVEAHGTGTRLGDPVEIEALNIAFNKNKNHHCAIGSVKTNIGHLDAAAGVAGLIKTALSLKYKKIPPSLHYKEPNPEIDFASGPFYVNPELKEWKGNGDSPLRAAVSSFGIGGTNAHAILENAPDQSPGDEGRPYKLLTFSAKTEDSLLRYINNVRDFLLNEPLVNLSDMSYTLQVGRKHFSYRTSVVCRNREELIGILNPDNLHNHFTRVKEKNSPVVFMFPGQGSQYINMGKDLYEKEQLFREEMDEGFFIIENLTGENFKLILFPETNKTNKINETRYTQPLIFLFEYSLARLLMSWGIKPQYMIGHSIGEYVAACISGVFSFESALQLVVRRGELMNSLEPGAMLSIAIKEEEARQYLNADISLAAVNSPGQAVLSGSMAAIEELIKELTLANISYVRLHASHAFHSGMQDAIMDEFRKELEKITFNKMECPFISNVTGNLIRENETTSPDYWTKHLRETVRFSDGIKTLLLQDPEMIFIEIGPGKSLTHLLKQQETVKHKAITVNLVRSPKETGDDVKYLTDRVGELWSRGAGINWLYYYKDEQRNRISLPTYSFEPLKYHTEVDPFEIGLTATSHPINPTRSQELKDWIYYPVWKSSTHISSDQATNKKSYLFFSSGNAFADALKSELLNNENEVVEVLMGIEYKKFSRDQYAINPVIAGNFKMLLDELQNENIPITDIVYGWSAEAKSSEIDLTAQNREIHLVYFSIVHLIQSLLENKSLSTKRITILTDSLHAILGNENTSYVQSLVLGLVNVLPQEYSVSCRNIDLNLEEEAKMLGRDLAEELAKSSVTDRIIAFRNGQRWIRDYERNTFPLSNEKPTIKKGGVYLITGGLGNVGFILAKHLIEDHQAIVVLTGRKKIDQVSQSEKSGKRLNFLKGLNENVSYYSLDVSDLQILKKTVAEIEKNIGTIQGVIHAAGNTDTSYFELCEDITYEKALAVFSPKVAGIENLFQVFKNAPLDFVWITSSLSSVLGGLSFSSYSSANLFMDYFISSKLKELPGWKCIGLSEMLFTAEEAKKENEWSRKALTPPEIAELFEWSISVKGAPVILQTIEDLSARIHKVYGVKKELYLDIDFNSVSVLKSGRAKLSNDYVAPETKSEEVLIRIMQDFFGYESIGVTDNFFELGGDSLKAMILLKCIRKEFKINFTLEDFFEAQNIRQMAAEIDERLWLNKTADTQFVSII